MKILNFGSLNIDNVYQVERFVKPGETISALSFAQFAGGKGLNQSIALARSGVTVFHAGKIGADGEFLKKILHENQINSQYLYEDKNIPSGQAIIQIDQQGENCIILLGSSNLAISKNMAREILQEFYAGDFLILQNEISMIREIIDIAYDRGIKIFLNPAPMNSKVFSYALDKVDTLIVNEHEAELLAGSKNIFDIQKKYSKQNILLTLGAKGAEYLASGQNEVLQEPAFPVEKVIDTTAAGDTFIGYFVAALSVGKNVSQALNLASKASSICIQKKGAVNSIPWLKDVECL